MMDPFPNVESISPRTRSNAFFCKSCLSKRQIKDIITHVSVCLVCSLSLPLEALEYTEGERIALWGKISRRRDRLDLKTRATSMHHHRERHPPQSALKSVP